MLPALLIVLGCAFTVTGLWPVGAAAFIGAAVQWKAAEPDRRAGWTRWDYLVAELAAMREQRLEE